MSNNPMFRTVELTVPGGAAVAAVVIPAFQRAPELLMWGERFFFRNAAQAPGVEEGDMYTEVFCVAVVPIEGVARNDGTDPAP